MTAPLLAGAATILAVINLGLVLPALASRRADRTFVPWVVALFFALNAGMLVAGVVF